MKSSYPGNQIPSLERTISPSQISYSRIPAHRMWSTSTSSLRRSLAKPRQSGNSKKSPNYQYISPFHQTTIPMLSESTSDYSNLGQKSPSTFIANHGKYVL